MITAVTSGAMLFGQTGAIDVEASVDVASTCCLVEEVTLAAALIDLDLARAVVDAAAEDLFNCENGSPYPP